MRKEMIKKKYQVIQGLIDKFEKEKIVIMGDMNGHTGILGERINKNGINCYNLLILIV